MIEDEPNEGRKDTLRAFRSPEAIAALAELVDAIDTKTLAALTLAVSRGLNVVSKEAPKIGGKEPEA